jgi:hypothetical protein
MRKVICAAHPASSEADIDAVLDVDQEVWGHIFPGDRSMMQSRCRTFPDCGLVLAMHDGTCVGFLSAQRVFRDDIVCAPDKRWAALTDDGTIRTTHKPEGDWLYGVGLAVTPQGGSCGASSVLIDYVARYAMAKSVRGAMLAARVPGYSRRAVDMSIYDYVVAKRRESPIDPELKIYARFGLMVGSPPIIITEYMGAGADPDSGDYGVVVEWSNPML